MLFETNTMSPHYVAKIYVQTYFSFGQYISSATFCPVQLGHGIMENIAQVFFMLALGQVALVNSENPYYNP